MLVLFQITGPKVASEERELGDRQTKRQRQDRHQDENYGTEDHSTTDEMAVPGKVLDQARLVSSVPIAVGQTSISNFFQGTQIKSKITHPKGEHGAEGQGLKHGEKSLDESGVKKDQANSRGDKRDQREALTTVSNSKPKELERPEEDTIIGSAVKRVLGSDPRGVES